LLEESHFYFTKAAGVLDLPPRIREILLAPHRVVKVEIVTESDGRALALGLRYCVRPFRCNRNHDVGRVGYSF
jgi:hypothetical protein